MAGVLEARVISSFQIVLHDPRDTIDYTHAKMPSSKPMEFRLTKVRIGRHYGRKLL